MAFIPDFSFDCVVGLGVREPSGPAPNERIDWIGTGTLVGRFYQKDSQEQEHYHIFLITNRHVLKNFDRLVIRFNPFGDQPALDYDIPLTTNNGEPNWVGHPDDDIDLAALGMDADFLNERGVRYDFFQLDKHGMPLDEMKRLGVSEGDFIYSLGFPLGIVDEDRQYVIARSGTIARLRDTLAGYRKDYLIDAFIFPGNSGGPVLYKPEIFGVAGSRAVNRAAFIGIVVSYLTYKDTAISQQTGSARIIFEENSGLAVVHPVDYVIETVERCFRKVRIKEIENLVVPDK